MTDDDWAMVYLAWLDSLPILDIIWRWNKIKAGAAYGHEGSCVKQPSSCRLCLRNECLEGGKQMKKAWEVEAAREKEGVLDEDPGKATQGG